MDRSLLLREQLGRRPIVPWVTRNEKYGRISTSMDPKRGPTIITSDDGHSKAHETKGPGVTALPFPGKGQMSPSYFHHVPYILQRGMG